MHYYSCNLDFMDESLLDLESIDGYIKYIHWIDEKLIR